MLNIAFTMESQSDCFFFSKSYPYWQKLIHHDFFYLSEDSTLLVKRSYFFIAKLMDINYWVVKHTHLQVFVSKTA